MEPTKFQKQARQLLIAMYHNQQAIEQLLTLLNKIHAEETYVRKPKASKEKGSKNEKADI